MKTNTAIILILISLGLFYTFTRDQYADVKGLQSLANQYQDILQNASDIASLRDDLLTTRQALPAAEIERVNKVLPDTVDTVRLALELSSIAARYNILLRNVRADTGPGGSSKKIVLPDNSVSYDRGVVSFSFGANYQNFAGFLADVEKSLRLMDVRSVSFQSNTTGVYDYQMTVETYWLK